MSGQTEKHRFGKTSISYYIVKSHKGKCSHHVSVFQTLKYRIQMLHPRSLNVYWKVKLQEMLSIGIGDYLFFFFNHFLCHKPVLWKPLHLQKYKVTTFLSFLLDFFQRTSSHTESHINIIFNFRTEPHGWILRLCTNIWSWWNSLSRSYILT